MREGVIIYQGCQEVHDDSLPVLFGLFESDNTNGLMHMWW